MKNSRLFNIDHSQKTRRNLSAELGSDRFRQCGVQMVQLWLRQCDSYESTTKQLGPLEPTPWLSDVNAIEVGNNTKGQRIVLTKTLHGRLKMLGACC